VNTVIKKNNVAFTFLTSAITQADFEITPFLNRKNQTFKPSINLGKPATTFNVNRQINHTDC